MSDLEGYGPVLRGGGDPAAPAAPTRPAPAAHGAGGGDGFGPPLRGRSTAPPPRTRRRLPLRGALAAMLAVVLAVPLGGGLLLLSANARIERVGVDGLHSGARPMNVLIAGTDSREGLSDEELLALGTERVGGDRTDTLLLLSISGGRAAMLSFPRDLWVPRCDGSNGRINTAHALGGPSCLVRTITETTGIGVTHYVEMNFVGFWRMVDAVGGVRMHIEAPMVDRHAGLDLAAGCQRLDGRQALGFVRARHIDNDLGRIARQQRFLRELVGEITAPSTLLNPLRLTAVAHAAAGSVTADDEMGVIDLLRLARGGRGMAGGGVAAYTVPVQGRRVGGAAVLVPVQAEAAALYERFRSGAVLEPEPEPEPAAPEPPGAPDGAPDGAPAPPAGGAEPEAPQPDAAEGC